MPGRGGQTLMHRVSAWGWFPRWEQKAQPGVGDAPQFAFETYALAPRSFIPGAYAVPMATRVTQNHPQIEHKLQHRIDGYGLVAGQINSPSLINPYLPPTPGDNFRPATQ